MNKGAWTFIQSRFAQQLGCKVGFLHSVFEPPLTFLHCCCAAFSCEQKATCSFCRRRGQSASGRSPKIVTRHFSVLAIIDYIMDGRLLRAHCMAPVQGLKVQG